MVNSLWTKGGVLSACVVVGGLTMLAGCGGGGSSGSDAATKASEPSRSAEFGSQAQALPASGSARHLQPTAILTDRKLVKTASIGLESTDVDRTLGELDGVMVTHHGIVESEDIRTDGRGDAESAAMVLRVPVDRFETAVDAIADLAELVREQRSAEDVTAQVVDVKTRVASAKRSIAQLQRLFSQATELGDVIALESELSRRQAELESLQARQRSLGRQTALSTIDVSITKPDPVRDPDDPQPVGFVAGLEGGASVLVTFVRGAAHLLGLVLPLGVVAMVVALPTWLVVRRFRLRREVVQADDAGRAAP